MAERKIKLNDEKKKISKLKGPNLVSSGSRESVTEIPTCQEVNSEEGQYSQNRQSRFSRNDIRTTRGNDFPSKFALI